MKVWATADHTRCRVVRRWVRGLVTVWVVVLIVAAIYFSPVFRASVIRAFGINPQSFLTGFAVAVATATFAIGQRAARHQSQKQHTIKILFDTRLSAVFRSLLDQRRAIYREGMAIPADTFFDRLNRTGADIGHDVTKRAERDGAEAVRALLNYYEFLSLGILGGDLDEDMLHKTVRSLMCNLVRDCHEVIVKAQSDNPELYENLAKLYNRWRDAARHPAL